MSKENEPYAQDCFFVDEKSVGISVAGTLYQKPIPRPHKPSLNLIPEMILKFISPGMYHAEYYRRGLANKLIRNEPNPFPMTGKPSSAFVYITYNSEIFLDFIIEHPQFKRNQDTTIHTYMSEFDHQSERNAYHPANLWDRQSMWSGHIASLTPEYHSISYGHILLLDKFDHEFSRLSLLEKYTISALHESGIIPISCRGQIINPSLQMA